MQEKPAYLRYTIQPGDTLSGIARRYGVTVGILQEVNAITNPDLIYAGQKIGRASCRERVYVLV